MNTASRTALCPSPIPPSAKVTATGKGNYACTKTAEFTIKKADVTMTAPEAKANLVYNAQAQALVAAGTVQGGEMQYASDGENFSTTLPTGTDAKEYTVSYKVVGDQNHNDVEAQNFKVTIDKEVMIDATVDYEWELDSKGKPKSVEVIQKSQDERSVIIYDVECDKEGNIVSMTDENGNVVLGDEMLTPDSSRFWPADGYEPGHSQPSFDKQFACDWLKANPGNDWTLPQEIVDKTIAKSLQAYELLTGEKLQ